MAIKYALSITDLVRDASAGPDGTVTRVYFMLTGTDEDGRSQSACHSVLLDAPPDDAEFIAFDDLTERKVKAWIKSAPIIAEYRERIAAALAEVPATAPEVVTPPWRKN